MLYEALLASIWVHAHLRVEDKAMADTLVNEDYELAEVYADSARDRYLIIMNLWDVLKLR